MAPEGQERVGSISLMQLASFSLARVSQRLETMTKSIDLISDAIRNPKHPFRQVDDRPEKQKKHRYERRKVKEIIRMGDWSEQTSA